jgi:3D (Asp-Asp-Asp) domain-containing protein
VPLSRHPHTLALLLCCAVALAAGACTKHVHMVQPAVARPSARSAVFIATAYCSGSLTASGTRVRPGIVAADPDVLPMGSVILVQRVEPLVPLDERHQGVYTVLDTGAKIRGRRIDIYLNDCREAVRFGRRSVQVTVLRPSRSG